MNLQLFQACATIMPNARNNFQEEKEEHLAHILYVICPKSLPRGYFFVKNIMLSIEGTIVNSAELKRSRIEIDQVTGLITKVSEPTGAADVVLKDELIFPGFIDLHVHTREDTSHTQDYKEDFTTAGEAAINGGVVAFAEMPNNPIPPIDDASYEKKKELTKKCPVEVVLYAGIGPNTKPLSFRAPYKVFFGRSVGDLFFNSLLELETVLAKYRGQYVSFHCEDPEILEKHKNEPAHELQRPPEAEISAIDFALELIQKYNLSGKICHVSTLEGLEKIIKAKKLGVNVTLEITPHHLYFSAKGGSAFGGNVSKMLQVNPPISQSRVDRLKIIEFLRNGEIDY